MLKINIGVRLILLSVFL